jgi:hypothetical protein
MGAGEGLVTEADVRAAQTTLDALLEAKPVTLSPAVRLEWRGILAGQFADVRAAGYIEGEQRGRLIAARIVRDALEGEGL